MAKTTKKAAKKPAAKKLTKKKTTTAKKPAAKKSRGGSAAFMAPMTPSAHLAAIVGAKPIPRTEVVKKLWAYIRKHGLQDPKNRRNIRADESLSKVFGGKDVVSMFEMTKLVNKHLSASA
jgi:chromatin remodeling complex protein RSC6